jgi:hypothetical protein
MQMSVVFVVCFQYLAFRLHLSTKVAYFSSVFDVTCFAIDFRRERPRKITLSYLCEKKQ